ncbi:MAG: alpha-amylase [Ignavibacteriae bacterium HGW-Ignavibacteriae-2]|jgi:glycosidase|nr:MAG: alpha-amylase [Ignavibacteriae bacterium HGW-Ignavibacteriae-2]
MKKLILVLIFISFSFAIAQTKNKDISRVPSWAKQAVWYQIFPERFNNADTANDPTVEDVVNIWPYIEPEGWQITPWTSDWFKRQPYEEKLNNYDYYQIQGMRRYGGDLQGIIEKLDYLKDLGITAIYINPVFESPSLHKYDAKMYRHIDNNFGPDPQKDIEIWNTEDPLDASTWKWTTADKLFLTLIKECHNRDIKIIIDGVFNHVGTFFWAFQDVVKNQENSKYKDWFTINKFDDPNTPENEFDYEGWIGVKDLPELKEDENGLIKPIKDHVFNVVKRWMDPNGDGDPSDGLDGWRLDVAEMVNLNFWKEFRTFVKNINPEAYITGEVWWQDWNKDKMFNAAPWLQGDAFDAVMNYRFARAVKNFVIDNKNKINSSVFVDSLNQISKDYNEENLYVLLNLMDSHDVDRLASQINNPDLWYDHNANPSQNKEYKVEAPDSIGRLKQKLIVVLQMTLPGAPTIYYGDEVGMWGGDDPDCRKPMVWSDLNYEDETTHPYGLKRNIDKVEFNMDLFNWYKNLISIRKNNPSLSLGTVSYSAINDNILSFKRSYQDENIYVIINNENVNVKINLTESIVPGNMGYTDLISGHEYLFKSDSILELEPYQSVILK